MAAIPHNVDLVDRYGKEGLVFIGVHDSNNGWNSAAQVVQDMHRRVAMCGRDKPLNASKREARSKISIPYEPPGRPPGR